jgi:hypothetical protein
VVEAECLGGKEWEVIQARVGGIRIGSNKGESTVPESKTELTGGVDRVSGEVVYYSTCTILSPLVALYMN